MAKKMTPDDYVAYIEKVSQKINENKDYITALDAATGDGDHWANLKLGFDKLLEQKEKLAKTGFKDLFKTCGMTLMSSVGGSSGALYGSAYIAAGKAAAGIETMDVQTLCNVLSAELDAIMKRGKSEPGHKTMIDSLYEAHKRMSAALEAGKSEEEALDAMKRGAIDGMEATKDMEAVRGRACYQANKGVGHLDPGAVTMCYQLEILSDCMMDSGCKDIHMFTELIENDMKVSLGVTEPGAIALCAAKARSLTNGEISSLCLELNSGIYKNAFTCGIPNTSATGHLFAAALGVVAGDWTKGLMSLDSINASDVKAAEELVDSGKVDFRMHEISSALYIKVTLKSGNDIAEVTIENAHDNISLVVLNGEVLYKQENGSEEAEKFDDFADITQYTLKDFWDYAARVPFSEIAFIQKAYDTNLALAQLGISSDETELCKILVADNQNSFFTKDVLKSAQAVTASAIEARVRGLALPAMSITGSGNHGIICTMPLYAYSQANGVSNETLLRATAISYLVTMYIKEYSGKLSAFCGCAVAAGTGAAVGCLFMLGGTVEQAGYVIDNMASGLTGVICTGGNPACVMKAAIAVDCSYKSVQMALKDIAVEHKHGINGTSPEQTMRFMGMIADPGMVHTEKTIVDILREKSREI